MIKVDKIGKYFGKKMVLDNISLSVEEGSVVTIIGPSGSGKSTLLRCMNLLEEPTYGEVYIDDMPIINGDVDINKVRSNMGMVFQSFNLFDNLDVLENCMLAQIKVLRKTKEEAQKTAIKLLEDVGMREFIYARYIITLPEKKEKIAHSKAFKQRCQNHIMRLKCGP